MRIKNNLSSCYYLEQHSPTSYGGKHTLLDSVGCSMINSNVLVLVLVLVGAQPVST